jgi:hypothetical protein
MIDRADGSVALVAAGRDFGAGAAGAGFGGAGACGLWPCSTGPLDTRTAKPAAAKPEGRIRPCLKNHMRMFESSVQKGGTGDLSKGKGKREKGKGKGKRDKGKRIARGPNPMAW